MLDNLWRGHGRSLCRGVVGAHAGWALPGDVAQGLARGGLREKARGHGHGQHEGGVFEAKRSFAAVVADPGGDHRARGVADEPGVHGGAGCAGLARVLASKLPGDSDPLVMPLDEGPVRGRAVAPLHPAAGLAASKDPKLRDLLALVDAIRIGKAREREVAASELRARI